MQALGACGYSGRKKRVFQYRTGILFALVLILAGSWCTTRAQASDAELRTPKPPEIPQIHGPRVYGVRPGHPFLYRIPSTGVRPMSFSALHLPAALSLDAKTGIISGKAPEKTGEYVVELKAANARGQDARKLKIVVGETIGLTPQMGWNDWYTHSCRVTESDMRKAAAALIASGMADFGYQYVDIDDCWMRGPGGNDGYGSTADDPAMKPPSRDADGNILSNGRFPDMAGLTAYIHSLGLKAGIYTSPGPQTCDKLEGAYQHEEADARRFAGWGFDLLKYDWCSYTEVAKGITKADFHKLVEASGKPGGHFAVDDSMLAELEKPYKKMGSILKGLDRDMVFNMCQYGMGEVWKWGKEVGGSSWRTTGDLGEVRGDSLPAFYHMGFANAEHSAYAHPGGWNDPDYILIGSIDNKYKFSASANHNGLTPDEQYSYMSMWSLMAAPLFFAGDMTTLDDLTRNVLCNAEVIDIDQDELGKQGRIVRKRGEEFVLAKPLEDGSVAVGLFNLTTAPRTMEVSWSELGLSGKMMARDVWRQRDLGSFAGTYSITVAPHGVEMVRMGAKKTQ
jgi:alpha-galactosidase